jgi:DNA-binding winged helix-turn-helix (wHTH) protein
MKTINNIVIFDNDQYSFALLKGYCFANHISLRSLDFNINCIAELEKLKPVLVIAPLDRLSESSKRCEASLLKQSKASGQVIICGLGKLANDMNPWIDFVVDAPLDISQIDKYLKLNSLLKSCYVEKRSCLERRSFNDRRAYKANFNFIGKNGDKQSNNHVTQQEPERLGCKDFQIDYRNKCVFINANKVDLTPKEFELVELLASEIDRIFMADEIINRLWPENNRATKSDLYQYMHLLRKKIEKDPNNPEWIQNIKGFGYKLNLGKSEQLDQALTQIHEEGALYDAYLSKSELIYM